MSAVVIDFDKMQCSVGKVQRLSTPSYVTCRTQCDAARWCWYWNSGNSAAKVWMLYEVQCCYVFITHYHFIISLFYFESGSRLVVHRTISINIKHRRTDRENRQYSFCG